ncbi:MAG: SMC-Scp complex subunit ScpB [Candidatus Paceibacterota bacterium]|jgi:segregation and condensation protein B
MQNTDTILEALLFVKTEPISRKKLAEFMKIDENGINKALASLKEKLSGRGVRIIENGDSVMLGTAPEASGFIEAILKEELNKDLGRAGLETVSIVLFKSPVTKTEIDFIRGVNSQFILRNLMVRGLIERVPNPNGRSSLYQPTFELLRYMGVSGVDELPDYKAVRDSLDNFKATTESEEGGIGAA